MRTMAIFNYSLNIVMQLIQATYALETELANSENHQA